MSLEETLRAGLAAELAPMRAELAAVKAELIALRQALPPQLVTLKDAAARMGVSLKTAQRRVRAGQWPARHDGRRILVDLGALRPLTDDEATHAAQRLRAVAGGAFNGAA